jgi:signal transduction histidine kinase
VEISVIDSGPGIPAENVERMFTAFSTTKPDGTGLGLAICRTIIEAHGGKLTYTPNPETGAIFKFRVRLTKGERTEEKA